MIDNRRRCLICEEYLEEEEEGCEVSDGWLCDQCDSECKDPKCGWYDISTSRTTASACLLHYVDPHSR